MCASCWIHLGCRLRPKRKPARRPAGCIRERRRHHASAGFVGPPGRRIVCTGGAANARTLLEARGSSGEFRHVGELQRSQSRLPTCELVATVGSLCGSARAPLAWRPHRRVASVAGHEARTHGREILLLAEGLTLAQRVLCFADAFGWLRSALGPSVCVCVMQRAGRSLQRTGLSAACRPFGWRCRQTGRVLARQSAGSESIVASGLSSGPTCAAQRSRRRLGTRLTSRVANYATEPRTDTQLAPRMLARFV